MRYIVRRPKPEELSDIKAQIPDLEKQLGKADANLKRFVPYHFTELRSAHYMLLTRKTDTGWIWVCPTIEFNAENEEGLCALSDHFKVPRPGHLTSP